MFANRSKFWHGAAVAAIMVVEGAAGAQSIARYRFDLPTMELADALRQVAVRTGTNLLAPDELVRGRRSIALSGEYSAEEAVQGLLQGSGLSYRFSDETLIIAAGAPANGSEDQSEARSETIVVTGSHVRGAPPTSPVITVTRKQIEEAAPASVEELMRRLPQNVSSGVAQENFAVTGTGADITQHGAGINLRGLGQRATLVLVDGRRVAPSGVGSFVDVSLLPISAIDRVEVLTDGASAIYGSDAVGGVVNFILRKDFHGIESMLQAGTTTQGGGRQLLAGVTGGTNWAGGRALLSYEYRDERPIRVRDRDVTINLPDRWMLSPREKRHSLYGAVRQELGNRLELDISALYSARDTGRSFFEGGSPVAVEVDAKARSLGGTAALGLDLGGSWALEGIASYFRSRTRQEQLQDGTLYNRLNTLNAFSELGLKADGPLVELPAGAVKLAAGWGLRRERFASLFATSVNAPTRQSGSRTVISAYGELNLPLFGARNRQPALEQLTMTAAGRFEHYEGIGSSFNPKLGLLWSPIEGLAFRGSYGTSFRAPLLSESFGHYNIFLFPAALLYVDPGQAPPGVGASLIGNNRDVRPESSKSFSVGVDVEPPTIPGLRLAATYYAIRFSDRIALPTEQVVVIGDPALAPIVTLGPNTVLVTGLFSGANQVLDFSGPGFTNGGAGPQDVVAIVDARVANTAETRTSGLDLLLNYAFELGSNRFNLSMNANKVFRFDDKLTEASPWIHTLNTPFHAVDWRARAGLSWTSGPLSAAAFLNYTDSYRDNRGLQVRPVRSFTTVDAGVAFNGAQGGWTWARPFRLALNVQNLFDADPPLLRPEPGFSRGIGYDPVNATGRGRTVSLQMRAGL